MVTGFARVHGVLCGIVANNGILFSESALKASKASKQASERVLQLSLFMFMKSDRTDSFNDQFSCPAALCRSLLPPLTTNN